MTVAGTPSAFMQVMSQASAELAQLNINNVVGPTLRLRPLP